MYICIYSVYICHTVGLFDMFYHIVAPQKLFTFFKNKGPGHKPCMFGCVNQVKVFIFIKSQLRCFLLYTEALSSLSVHHRVLAPFKWLLSFLFSDLK